MLGKIKCNEGTQGRALYLRRNIILIQGYIEKHVGDGPLPKDVC